MPSRKNFDALLIQEWIAARQKSSLQTKNDLPDGITLIGFLSAANGLGEAARSSLRAIQAAGIPYSLVDLNTEIPDRQRIAHPAPDAPTGFSYRINLIHANPNHFPFLWEKYGSSGLIGRQSIGVWYWELPEIPEDWMPAFQVLDEIWAPTNFIREAIQKCSPIPVHFIPPCIEVHYDETISRTDFGLPDNSFLFLCAYDVNSVQVRKNPEGVVKAFKNAFSIHETSVGLVIKINNAEENPEGISYLEESLSGYTNVYFIKRVLSREHFNTLIHLVDAYVSLHRSEGFGLVAAEAMYLGKPVIMTKWSGNTDFMTEDNSCGVDYRLIPVGKGAGPYNPDQQWAEPNLAQASKLMRQLLEDPDLVERISKHARETIIQSYSTCNLAQMIIKQLSH